MRKLATLTGVVAVGMAVSLTALAPNQSEAAFVAVPIGTANAPGVAIPALIPADLAGNVLVGGPLPSAYSAGGLTGTVTTSVYVTLGGTLDFYYSVSNTGTDIVARTTHSDFNAFSTDIGYIVGAGFIPETADRVLGSSVGVDWVPVIGVGPSGSVTYVIRTNATTFSGGFVSVINGTADTVASYSPVPIPGAVWLFGSGVLGLLGIGYTRRRQAAA